MTSTRVRLTTVLVLAASAACSPDEGAHHRVEEQPIPAELPRIQSKKLDYLLHSSVERVPIRYLSLTGPRTIHQKILLLTATGDEPSYQAARDALDRIGMPYQAVTAVSQDVTDAMLTDGASTCNFSAVLFATSGLGFWDPAIAPAGAWTSALSPDEWSRIDAFEVACGAREAVWYAWPSPDLGLAFQSGFSSDESVDGLIADTSFFLRVPSGARIPYRHAAGYRASIVDPTVTRAIVRDASGGVLLAVNRTVDGREQLISTVDSNPYLAHSLALEYDMLRWLTRGIFVGEKRSYLAPQIDDIFLDNDMWVVGSGNTGSVQFRITGSDLDAFVSWQQGFRGRLPAGSSFIATMAFNGLGTLTSEYPDGSLLRAATRAGSKLTWLNHTWDHENMDAMTRAEARDEVARNCKKAKDLKLHGFSCFELVTPDMSGLTNLPAVQGMLDAGTRFVVSDTSITELLRPANPGTNPSFNVGRVSPTDARLYQIPRHPTSVFYDVREPATELDEYNHIYHDYYGRDLTYEEFVDKASEFGFYYLMQGDIDPLMFHQANLANYGGGHSLYGDFVEAVAKKFLALSKVPVLTLNQRGIGDEMKSRAQLNGCNASARIVESSTGGRSLVVSGSSACSIPVTGISAPTFGSVSVYGGEATTSFSMGTSGGSVTIPLP